jgi:hypothetical protein
MTSLLPPLLVAHVALALALLLPAVLLPLLLRGSAIEPVGAGTRGLVALQARGSVPLGLGVALTGVGLLLVLGVELLGRPWLIVALSLYGLNLGIAVFVQRPALGRLLGRAGPAPAGTPGEVRWPARLRRLRWVSYAMATLIGAIGFLMSTKPELW